MLMYLGINMIGIIKRLGLVPTIVSQIAIELPVGKKC